MSDVPEIGKIDDVLLRDYVDPLPASLGSVRIAPISEQADLAEQVGTEGLYFCADPWALRHRFINNATGETVRVGVIGGIVSIAALAKRTNGGN